MSRLRKGFSGYVLSNKLSWHYLSSLQHHVHTRHRWSYDEQNQLRWCKHHYKGCQLSANLAYTWKCLRSWGNLCSSAAYINF